MNNSALQKLRLEQAGRPSTVTDSAEICSGRCLPNIVYIVIRRFITRITLSITAAMFRLRTESELQTRIGSPDAQARPDDLRCAIVIWPTIQPEHPVWSSAGAPGRTSHSLRCCCGPQPSASIVRRRSSSSVFQLDRFSMLSPRTARRPKRKEPIERSALFCFCVWQFEEQNGSIQGTAIDSKA